MRRGLGAVSPGFHRRRINPAVNIERSEVAAAESGRAQGMPTADGSSVRLSNATIGLALLASVLCEARQEWRRHFPVDRRRVRPFRRSLKRRRVG